MKIRAETKEIENRKTTEKIYVKGRRHKLPMNETWDIATDVTDNKCIIREYNKKFYKYNFENLDEMDQFFKKYKLPQLMGYERHNLNSPVHNY
jgi:hypothetical protein